VLAKSTFYHTLFVFMMVLGLNIQRGRWFERALQAVPEPSSKSIYLFLVLVTFAIGMIPFLFFSQENFFVTIYKSIFAGRSGEGAAFTAGRTGNVNYNWGGYIAQLADVGMMGAILAAFHAIMVTRNVVQKVICWGIWALWMAICFGTGTRGFVVFMGMPVILLLFLKYNYKAAAAFRRITPRAYIGAAVVGLIAMVLMQIQGQFRNVGFYNVGTEDVEMTQLRGNEMFTTTLVGMKLVPGNVGYFHDRFFGEGLMLAIPESIYWFVIGPIPRAGWHDKPIDQVGVWYSTVVTGKTTGVEGTTISGGAVGTWFWKFGPMGVLQCGLLYGWMMSTAERALRRCGGRPMALLFILAYCTFLFRAFRDLWWHNLYPVIIGGVVMYVFVRIANTLFGGGGGDAAHDPTLLGDGSGYGQFA
jgi:oligosaccharide repeat unit polymerase